MVDSKLKDAMSHVAFSVLLCLKQAKAGRKFVLEHPAGATSWHTMLVNKLYFVEGAQKVNFDFCMAGMKSLEEGVEMPAKKRTSVVTNLGEVAEALRALQCDGKHQHVTLLGGKSKACEVYPEQFCKIVCEAAVKAQRAHDQLSSCERDEMSRSGADKTQPLLGAIRNLRLNQVSSVRDVTKVINAMNEGPHEKDIYEEYDFVDDISGRKLNHELAKAARRLEI